MILFNSIKSDIVSVNSVLISWDISADDGDVVSDFSYQLLKSVDNENEFSDIITFDSSLSMFTDTSVNTMRVSRRYYYKIVATSNVNPGVSYESDIITAGSSADCVALEIIRKEKLYLKQYIKTRAYIISVRTSGQKCTHCWNEITGERMLRNCPSCFGSGFEGGFYPPVPIYIEIAAETDNLRPTPIGPNEVANTTGWTSNCPIIKSNDIIVEVDSDSIWRAVDISHVNKNRFMIKQMIRLSRIDRGSNLYDYKIPDQWNDPWPDESLTGVPHVES